MRTVLIWLVLVSLAAAQTSVGPFYIGFDHSGVSDTSMLMDGANDKVAYIITAPMTGTVTKVGIRLGTVTEEDTLAIGIYAVGTDGKPTGAALSTAGTLTFLNGDDNTTQECTLGASLAVTAGEEYAVVISFNSYVDGNLNVNAFTDPGTERTRPYIYQDTGAGYALTQQVPMLYLYYSDSGGQFKIPLGCVPPGVTSSVNIQSDTNPDEIAFQYTAPVAMRLCGVTFTGREFGTTADINIDLFNSAATPASLLTNPSVTAHDSLPSINDMFTFNIEPESLTAGQVVYVGVFSEDATNNLQIYYLDVSNASHFGDWCQGIVWASRQRTDDTPGGGPAFTPLTTRKPIGGLWFDQITTAGGVIGGGNKQGNKQ